ncbi:M20 metallopeptidase family protein [Culicoidibacter larvae]|uniref:Amidohydrolase n=1 Tax=Culicoidibacter larvae TaxID=2579976 RepID=A0A5R8QFK4_9FIRM|nr:M20 family metallopeptidase [Culicoidibacter larvae]TLG76574.1 amidohydrolase [Culicoidibacter larvae]
MNFKQLQEKVVFWRRNLHQIPELGFKEEKTAAFIREQLNTMGLVYETVCGTGTLVFLDAGSEETLAFRADIDGLQIAEETGSEFQSQYAGMMHACGHDGHTATMLGFANFLALHKPLLMKNILLIFQPAEEGPGGAKAIIDSGAFTKYKVKAVYGLHVWPELTEGIFGSKPGPLLAQNGELEVVVHGKSAHGAMPHDGVDAIVVATDIIQQYQTILSRQISPMFPAVINIGKINGGDAANIVAERVEFQGTVRVFSDEAFYLIKKQIENIHRAAEIAYGCKIEWRMPAGYPPVINDTTLFKTVEQAFAKFHLPFVEFDTPFMPAEDFAFYQQEVPGVFFFLGVGNVALGNTAPLHNSKFDFNSEILVKGVEAFVAIAANGGCFTEAVDIY